MLKFNLSVLVFLIFFSSCSKNQYDLSNYSLPEICDGKCEPASDINSFYDAVLNSSALFSNCICLGEGVFDGLITVAKPLVLVGRNDGLSYLKNLVISNSYYVKLKDFSFKSIDSGSGVLYILGSSVEMENILVSDISASSISGGRGIIISGEESDVKIKNSKIEKTAGTGLLINGNHTVSLENVTISDCGFTGIWVQNHNQKKGNLSISNSKILNSAAAGIEILGNSSLKLLNSKIEKIQKRDFMLESVGDGIVIKNSILSNPNSLIIENSEIGGFSRAGIILDGEDENLEIKSVFKDLKIFSDNGSFGIVVQNGFETSGFRNGVIHNDFA